MPVGARKGMTGMPSKAVRELAEDRRRDGAALRIAAQAARLLVEAKIDAGHDLLASRR